MPGAPAGPAAPGAAAAPPAWTRAAAWLIDLARSLLNGAAGEAAGSGAKAYARATIASYAACAAAVLVLRDPVLLFAAMIAAVVVFFREWWYLLVAAAVPMVYYITATHNVLSGDVVSHVVSAASALNLHLTLVFAGVAAVAALPSVAALVTLDLGEALAKSTRFLPISLVLVLKGMVEYDLLDSVGAVIGQFLRIAAAFVNSLVPGARFLTGVLGDAFGW
jgi:hypothetical protein